MNTVPVATSPTRRREIWTFAQRRTLLGLSILLLLFRCLQSWRQPVLLTDPPAMSLPRANEIQDRINPNTASAAELAAIPNLGESRAHAIVDYRDALVRQHPGAKAFASTQDLMRVKGIGVGIAADLGPFLIFAKQ